MKRISQYNFDLPSEVDVIRRNRTITTYYAQLYQNEPVLFKWAGMAAFASFHIGEKLKVYDWNENGIKTFSETCKNRNASFEDDFQIIRIINNKIFSEIGVALLRFSQFDYETFKNQLIVKQKDEIIILAFDKLNEARVKMSNDSAHPGLDQLIWDANTQILWHEQSKVVQPLFDKLSLLFSTTMSVIASFDYRINHTKTNWKLNSRFLVFMLSKGFKVLLTKGVLPDVTNLEHRWLWITSDLLRKWKIAVENKSYIMEEIKTLSTLELRSLNMKE